MVRANGATSGFRPVNDPRTLSSINSMIISTKFCPPAGTLKVALFAILAKRYRNIAPSMKDTAIVSTLIAQNPMALACSGVCANPNEPSGNSPKVRFCRWCLIYSVEVCVSLAINTLLYFL